MKKLACSIHSVFVPAAAAGLFGQDTTGAITGTVSDPSGASVAGAEVKILNSQTGFSRTARTGEAGEYRIPFVPPGIYDVTAQHQGFKTQTQQALRVEIQQTRTVNFGLELGATAETILVQSTAPLLEAETSQAGTVIKNEQVNNLPLNVRQFMQPHVSFADGYSGHGRFSLHRNQSRRDGAGSGRAAARAEQLPDRRHRQSRKRAERLRDRSAGGFGVRVQGADRHGAGRVRTRRRRDHQRAHQERNQSVSRFGCTNFCATTSSTPGRFSPTAPIR